MTVKNNLMNLSVVKITLTDILPAVRLLSTLVEETTHFDPFVEKIGL